jgi:hypothetical protein
MPRTPQPPSLESKSFKIGDKDPKNHGMQAKNVDMVNYQCDGTNDGS